MNTAFVYDTFERWISKPTPPSLRRGQYLFNEAPPHILEALKREVGFDPDFDPFELDWAHIVEPWQLVAKRFVALCEICWDIKDPAEIALAIRIVLDEYPPD